MRYWENDGKPITDGSGRFCLVMDPEDGTHPIRTYGRTKEEVYEKVARTAETAQAQINRMRNAPAAAAPSGAAAPSAPLAPRRATVTAGEIMEASQAITNGETAKMANAVKTLLRSEGFDVDELRQTQVRTQVAATARAWNQQHPEFPDDDRNARLLIDKASLMFGFQNITAESLDAAYAELVRMGMIFDEIAPAPLPSNNPTPTPAQGTETPSVARTRNATSYSRNNLRAVPPAARREPLYTRAQVDAMTTKELREKSQDPVFAQWYNEEFSTAVA